MDVKYKDIRPGDMFFLLGKDGESGYRTLPAQLGPDDQVFVDRWYGFPDEPYLRRYLDWMEQELADCIAAVRKMRDEPDADRFAETKLMERMRSLRPVLDVVEFPLIRQPLTRSR